jgi:threonine dehydrogenase-like Zn-dependent dehydrogenase
MGHETVGRVVAMGPTTGSSGIKVGQVVTVNPVIPCGNCQPSLAGDWQQCPERTVIGVDPTRDAAFAQYIAVPETNVVALTDDTPVLYGALIEPLAVAFHAARLTHINPHDKVLILGGGPIGQSLILAVQRLGVQNILVSEVDKARRELCERLGARALDPIASNLTDQVLAAFGQLADVSIDAVGIKQTLADALEGTKFGGQVCLVGMGAPFLEIDAYQISTKERSIIGSFTYSADDFREAAEWVSIAPLELQELISREVNLNSAPEAFAQLAVNDGTPGKVLIRFGD